MHTPTDLRTRLSRPKEHSVPKLPPKDPRDIGPEAIVKQSSIGLPQWLWKRLDEISEATGYTRNEIFREAMRAWVDEQEVAPARKSSK